MPITAWDKFARISCLQSVPPVPLPEPIISIDFRPVYMDNIALQELGVTGSEFDDAFSGVTPSVDCQEYTYQLEQSGINWDERIWTNRLYWILKKERELGVKVHDISQHGQHWESTLSDLLRTSRAALNATPFKGVTDVLLLGKTNTLLIFVKDDDAVDATWSEGIDTKTILIEVGMGQIARVYCPNYQNVLPTKLGELLSSMYLIGVALSLRMPKSPFHRIKVYGWLIFKANFNLGVELLISNDKPQVNILFVSSNFVMLNHYFNYLHKFVK